VADIQDSLAQMLEANKFEPYIRYIRFPEFRNLRDGTRIDFSHPVTTLVGPNGTNKTAILRALQGCPDNVNLGMHWFSTDLDPIEEGARHRFIYGYIAESQSTIVEVVKSRIKRGANPDYFEPARPILADGMQRMPPLPKDGDMPPERTRTRWRAIPKAVVYLDFRSELSAFDKYWFHVPYNNRVTTLGEKKALIRRRAVHLARALVNGDSKVTLWQRERIIKAAQDLNPKQVAAVSEILGREYENVRVITHRFFDVEGSSVVLSSRHLRYSEAFAGSGEFAVAMLVKAVTEADDRALILLDEPETSLHPGAQKKLVRFLSEQARDKRLQVVLSTHAPEIVRQLPAQAIKVLQASPTDGKVELLAQSSDPAEAFFRLGIKAGEDISVYVEDGLSAAIIRRAIRPLGEAKNSMIRITPLPGGASAIQTRFIPSLAQSHSSRCMVFLDGDQAPTDPLPVSAAEVSEADLEVTLEKALRGKPKISVNGSGGAASVTDKLTQYHVILDWVIKNVRFLPGNAPESLLIQITGNGSADELDAAEAKEFWVTRARTSLGRESWEDVTSSEIFAEQERALAGVSQDSEELSTIRSQIQKFIDEIEVGQD
jgi:predicted ATPase